MNSKMVNPVFFCKGNRIVKIFCIFSVYGDHLHVSKVKSSVHICRKNVIRHAKRLVLYTFRKFVRDSKAFYNGKNICSRRTAASQDFCNLSFRAFVSGTIVCNFRNDFISVFHSIGIFFGNKHIFGKLGIVADHEAKIPVALVRSHNLGHSPFQNLYHCSLFSFSFFLFLFYNNAHFILMESCSRFFFRNKNIFLLIRDFHKTKSFRVPDKGSLQSRIFIILYPVRFPTFLSSCQFFLFLLFSFLFLSFFPGLRCLFIPSLFIKRNLPLF